MLVGHGGAAMGALSLSDTMRQTGRRAVANLRREGIIEDDPGALVATPKRDIRMPAHLSEQEVVALIAAAPDTTPLGRAATPAPTD